MPVARRVAKARLTNAQDVDDQTWGILTDQITVDDLPEEGWDRLVVKLADTLPEPNLHTAWNTYREEIVAAWARDYPGTRPSCWWRWDAPEPERRVVAEPEVLVPFWGAELEVAFVESEAAFLERHGLFLDGEAELLSADDYAPQRVENTPQGWTCAGEHGLPRRSAALRRLAAS